MGIKIQLISDTHLEFRKNSITDLVQNHKQADILILAGDISLVYLTRYLLFLEYCAKNYQDVILIAGNHEYYHGKGVDHVEKKITNIVEEVNCYNLRGHKNLHYLQRGYVDISGIRFIGCTLWSDTQNSVSSIVEKGMSDYRKIKMKIVSKDGTKKRRVKITTNNTNCWHQRDISWLEKEIANSPLPVVVVTHHAPSFDGTLQPKYSKDKLNSAYATDLELMMHPKIRLWCYGHTHQYNQRQIFETTIWSNPLGYPDESTGYKPDEIYEIDL